MILKKILNQKVKDLNYTENLIIFVFYLIFTVLISIIFSFYFIRQFPDFFLNDTYELIVNKIPFGYGNLLTNIFENNQYINSESFKYYNDGEFQKIININFVLKKLPFYSYLLYFLLSISKNIFFIVIVKNLIFFNIFYFSVFFSLRSLNLKVLTFIIILIFFLFIPYNVKTFSEISFADSISSILLSCLFIISISQLKLKFFICGIFLFILYLTKESMFTICLFFPIIIIFFEYKSSKKLTFIPFYFVLSAIFLWGFNGLYKTGSFPFGSSLSTWKSYDMSKAFDESFSDYYPKYSTDFIDSDIIDEPIANEWEFYNYYKSKNLNLIKEDSKTIFDNTVLKIKFILFNIIPDGYQFDKNINTDFLFITSSIINKFIFYIAVLFFLINLFLKRNFKNYFGFYFFTLMTFNLIPHILGWATSKHMVGIYLLSFLYIIVFFQKNLSRDSVN